MDVASNEQDALSVRDDDSLASSSPPEPVYSPTHIPSAPVTSDGMWRWSRLLPLNGKDVYPLHVGDTPLVHPKKLSDVIGLPNVFLKDETIGPSGSNKDRATALSISDAVMFRNAPAIACASSGNVGVSLAVGGASVGLPTVVFVAAARISPAKVELMRAFGATIVAVDGEYPDAYLVSESVAQTLGWYNRNTATNPLALQAKKTVAFEIWEQLGRRVPDIVVAPVGDGVTIAALELGFRELISCGVADTTPRLIGVQAKGAAPLARAFRTGRLWKPVTPRTFADGIAVGDPQFGREALDAVRRSNGEFVTVSDDDLRRALAFLAETSGILGEPAGVASIAALMTLAKTTIAGFGDAFVVALITGTGLKDHRWWPRGRGLTLRVSARVADFPFEEVEGLVHRNDKRT